MMKFLFSALAVFVFLITGSCSKQEKAEYINVTVSAPTRESVNEFLSQRVEFGLKGNFGLPDPTTVGGIGCYGVFIEYPELPPINFCEDVSSNLLTSPDDMFGMFPSAQTEFDIPVLAGANRRIVILAFAESLGFCPPIKSNFGPIEANLSHPILIGDVFVDIFGGTTEVDVNANISTGTRIDDCFGPLFNQFDGNFQPTSIPGLIGWWDPSDTSTVFNNTGCGSPATFTTDEVRCITDKSGNSNDFTVGGGPPVRRPDYIGAGINGLPALGFDGTNKFMDNAAIQQQNDGTYIVIFETSDVTASTRSMIGSDNADASTLSLVTTSKNLFGEVELRNATGAASNNSGTPQLAMMVWDGGGDNTILHINDPTVQDGSDAASGVPFTPDTNIMLGAESVAGSDTNHYQGKLGEVMVFNRRLNTTELIQIRNYLRPKWGTP